MKKIVNKSKIMSFVLVLSMLISALFVMPVGAADVRTVETVEIDGETYTVEYTFWSNVPRERVEEQRANPEPMTEQEISDMFEAMMDIDYENYELIIDEEDYTLKRIELKHGFSIDYIYAASPLNPRARSLIRYATATIEIRDPNGNVVSSCSLAATFTVNKGVSVNLSTAHVTTTPAPGGAFWSNTGWSSGGSTSVELNVVSRPVFNTPVGTSSYQLAVGCDKDGNTWGQP